MLPLAIYISQSMYLFLSAKLFSPFFLYFFLSLSALLSSSLSFSISFYVHTEMKSILFQPKANSS